MRDIEIFTEMTGDKNPIHYDVELATNSPFGGLIVQGGVTTGLLNAVVAEDLPGPGTVFLETNWRFVKAVRVGETITASVKVEHVRDDKPILLVDIGGYWVPLRALLDHIVVNGFARPQTRLLLHVVPSVSALMAALSEEPAGLQETDIEQL